MYRVIFLLLICVGSFKTYGQSYLELTQQIIQLFQEEKFAQAQPIALKAREAAFREFGSTSQFYALSLTVLATSYKGLGDYISAETYFKQSSDILKNLVGSAHPDYANSLISLADLYVNMNKYSDAEKLYKQALTIRENVGGIESKEYGFVLNNLAYLYQLKGDYRAAEPLYQTIISHQ